MYNGSIYPPCCYFVYQVQFSQWAEKSVFGLEIKGGVI